ncbi:MAG: cysteine desulfurase CsdA [Zetaproteobacteria bacterium CG_4_9_14_3_um_filter_49_83]|nr:MAG: cysteine sulfinate desulfinase [Zetaproteobacteria bacterium CG1_02_49_23]PIQ33397.1 MAG: cysteine desulfurase CsdA [Zetaproteobacteria bacterium CG17_big_fil_post_rev_8_21_14_2_50_50_13]PIV31614.1 MAG: cysteine desulfurase CsdA [Zetaproteobacteria bacterium CG02_land_8_20_14_3_00_50_9]PIY55760.1 MAG: cysteine desulfurase CsdA [Zetaproteobacteria bacterium CG_4_10_14_0_8_um_filter_49_80]PJA35080.1 MAG: cysteine desulfurase CsdA [Zetaproteobacteria bacterium CG_4_9_14_3_um_filter_49_83]
MNVNQIRQDFPILQQQIHGKPLVYLDNAATTQKPQCVIDTVRHYYEADNANIHRGVHTLSERATAAYEDAREIIRAYFNAASTQEVIFTRGTTESINLVASAWGNANVKKGDEILITHMEHHSNIVPWQMLCQRTGASLKVVPMNDAGELRMDLFAKLLSERTKLVGVVHMSNALGTLNPIESIIQQAHAVGAKVLVDGAQAASHVAVDVQALDVDFYATSAHKMYGPTGVGVLIGKQAILAAMPPYQGGGDMILTVSFDKTRYNALPHKFEAGTPNIAGVIGFGAAIKYIQSIGLAAIASHEKGLLDYASVHAGVFDGLTPIGTAANKACVLSFVIKGVHPHDLGTILDREGVAIRAGHHCAMPVMQYYKVPATARASFAMYNTKNEIDALFSALAKARAIFA